MNTKRYEYKNGQFISADKGDFVKCIDSADKITKGDFYHVFCVIKTTHYQHGKALVIEADNHLIRGYDPAYFEEV